MSHFRASPAVRLFLFVVSLNIWLGIWLTGFGVAHWWLYVPAGFLLFASLTGFCPGMIFSRWLLKENQA
jgi:hypothetical protein